MLELTKVGDFSEPVRPNGMGFFPVLPDGVHEVSTGEGSQFSVALMRDGGGLYVGVVGLGFYRFTTFVHRSYASEKLKAGVLADFINDQLGLRSARQVLVQPDLVREWNWADFPVQNTARLSLVDEAEPDRELAKVSMTGVGPTGTQPLMTVLLADLAVFADWRAQWLYNGVRKPAPSMFEQDKPVASEVSQTPAEYFAARHAERVRSAQ